MAPLGSPAKIAPTLVMSSSSKAPLLPPSEQTRTKHPHNNDVLCGRGGTINSHPGNEQYRLFVERKKRVYLTARFKREKRLIAQSIVDEVRKLDPPGRFLMKESIGDWWIDVGDEKARDKTSQALRENSMSVRRQIEEEFKETRRQQAREVAIAAGRDPDKAVDETIPKPHLEPPQTGGLQPPTSGLQPRLTGLQPPGTGYTGASGYGPLYDAQQPNPPSRTVSQHAPVGLHPTQYSAHRTAYEQPPQMAVHYPPPTSYYAPDGHRAASHHHYPYAYGSHPSQQMMPTPAYDPHYSHHMPPLRSASPHGLIQSGHHMTHAPPVMADPHHQTAHHQTEPVAPSYPQYPHQAQQSDPVSAFRRRSSKEDMDRHVQFQSTEHPRYKTEIPQAPIFPPFEGNEADIPLEIGTSKRSPKRHPQPRTQPFHSTEHMLSESPLQYQAFASMPQPSSPQMHFNQDETLTVSSPKTMQSSALSHTDMMSQATPLTFMSNTLSLKTEDSLAKYLQGMEDEIAGDVGQEVELVAHAPMLNPSEHSTEHETIVPRHHQRYHGSLSRSTADSFASSSYRGTPPRHRKSSRRRRKHRSAGHIPSNSGKVQLDLSAAAFEGSRRDATSPTAAAREGPCGQVAVSCGGMLPVPSPIVGRRQHQEASSPVYPLSPNSLDIDKMSLCGTENISQGGSLIGGASLMNVFEEHDSLVGANALMDMSVSLGSGAPSSASSLKMGLQQNGAQYGDQESLMGASALMDLSVGSASASHSRSSLSGNGSKTHSSSDGSSSKRNRRPLSPASIDKRFASDADHQAAAQDQGWTWEGKSTQE